MTAARKIRPAESLPIDAPGRRRLPILLRHAWYGLNQAFRRRIAHLGITPDQFTVMRTLLEAGGIYRAIAPTKQVYKPTEWNKYHVLLKGSHLKVVLNGETIQDLNLEEQAQSVKRHNGKDAPPVKDRPRKGHIGFQELSRGSEHAQIRNARIKVLD